jgi:hypothetical protein
LVRRPLAGQASRVGVRGLAAGGGPLRDALGGGRHRSIYALITTPPPGRGHVDVIDVPPERVKSV